MKRARMTRLLALMALMMPAAAASAETAPPAGSDYVAMGSSYAAGLAIGTKNPDGPARCGRSLDNYAQQLARKRGLRLIDASCSGATTEHILGAWQIGRAHV